MGLKYEDLEELCHVIGEKIIEANEKIRTSAGDLTGGDLEYIDKLTHTLKSIKTTMAMMEAESGDYGGYSYGRNGGHSYRGAKRDGMGRYTRGRYYYGNGYTRDDENAEIIEQLKDIMDNAGDEKTKQEFQRFIKKIESM